MIATPVDWQIKLFYRVDSTSPLIDFAFHQSSIQKTYSSVMKPFLKFLDKISRRYRKDPMQSSSIIQFQSQQSMDKSSLLPFSPETKPMIKFVQFSRSSMMKCMLKKSMKKSVLSKNSMIKKRRKMI